MSKKDSMDKEASARIQSHADKTNTNQDFKTRAQHAAEKKELVTEEYISLEEALKILQIDRATFYSMVKEGHILERETDDGKNMYRKRDVEQVLYFRLS